MLNLFIASLVIFNSIWLLIFVIEIFIYKYKIKQKKKSVKNGLKISPDYENNIHINHSERKSWFYRLNLVINVGLLFYFLTLWFLMYIDFSFSPYL